MEQLPEPVSQMGWARNSARAFINVRDGTRGAHGQFQRERWICVEHPTRGARGPQQGAALSVETSPRGFGIIKRERYALCRWHERRSVNPAGARVGLNRYTRSARWTHSEQRPAFRCYERCARNPPGEQWPVYRRYVTACTRDAATAVVSLRMVRGVRQESSGGAVDRAKGGSKGRAANPAGERWAMPKMLRRGALGSRREQWTMQKIIQGMRRESSEEQWAVQKMVQGGAQGIRQEQ